MVLPCIRDCGMETYLGVNRMLRYTLNVLSLDDGEVAE